MASYQYNLVDADSLVYAAGFACQTRRFTVDWKDPILIKSIGPPRTEFDGVPDLKRYIRDYHSGYDRNDAPLTLKKIEALYLDDLKEDLVVDPLQNCLHTVMKMIEKIQKRVIAEETMIFLAPDTSENYRVSLDPEYKANRVAAKPAYYEQIRHYIANKYPDVIFVDPQIEVDDAISICANTLRKRNKSYCITRIDKDLRQIPGTHYLWQKDTFEEVGVPMARRTLWKQVLTGDAADNIKGLPKVGPIKAAKMLKHIDWTAADANDQALRVCGLEYAIRFDDPETELYKTIGLVKLLQENIFMYPNLDDTFI